MAGSDIFTGTQLSDSEYWSHNYSARLVRTHALQSRKVPCNDALEMDGHNDTNETPVPEVVIVKYEKWGCCIQLFLLIGMFSCFAGCLSADTTGSLQEVLAVPMQEEDTDNGIHSIEPDGESSSNGNSSSLAGACPLGRHCCGSPGCSLWTDLDNDGCCYLGIIVD